MPLVISQTMRMCIRGINARAECSWRLGLAKLGVNSGLNVPHIPFFAEFTAYPMFAPLRPGMVNAIEDRFRQEPNMSKPTESWLLWGNAGWAVEGRHSIEVPMVAAPYSKRAGQFSRCC